MGALDDMPDSSKQGCIKYLISLLKESGNASFNFWMLTVDIYIISNINKISQIFT
jgi:hypothetical protein